MFNFPIRLCLYMDISENVKFRSCKAINPHKHVELTKKLLLWIIGQTKVNYKEEFI